MIRSPYTVGSPQLAGRENALAMFLQRDAMPRHAIAKLFPDLANVRIQKIRVNKMMFGQSQEGAKLLTGVAKQAGATREELQGA